MEEKYFTAIEKLNFVEKQVADVALACNETLVTIRGLKELLRGKVQSMAHLKKEALNKKADKGKKEDEVLFSKTISRFKDGLKRLVGSRLSEIQQESEKLQSEECKCKIDIGKLIKANAYIVEDDQLVVYCECGCIVSSDKTNSWAKEHDKNELKKLGIKPGPILINCSICGKKEKVKVSISCGCAVCPNCVARSAAMIANYRALHYDEKSDAESTLKQKGFEFSCPQCNKGIEKKELLNLVPEQTHFSNIMRVFSFALAAENDTTPNQRLEYCCIVCFKDFGVLQKKFTCDHLVYCPGCKEYIL